MAASTAYRRLFKFGTNSILNSTKLKESTAARFRLHSSLSNNSRYGSRYIDTKHMSELVNANDKRLFIVDTYALVRRLEEQGFPPKQAEVLTGAITKVLNDSLESVAYFFVTKPEMHNYEVTRESSLATFKTEIQSSQEHHFSLLQRETEKLQDGIEKLRCELKYAVDKVTAGQKLDLNLERGRIRDELHNQSTETSKLTNKLDKEIHALKAQLESQKAEVLKYCTGTLVAISAVGIAMARVLL
ncbi:protein FMP32, mitochondrial-like [Silene latifolia]|uniref:protein FMP32, mitochondrial-like n=1 Tax=Silene latifolia TaxID=37657 RepID=UPI003D7865B5